MTREERASLRRLLDAIAGELETAPEHARAKAETDAVRSARAEKALPAERARITIAYEAGLTAAACRQGAYGIRAVISAFLTDTKVRAT